VTAAFPVALPAFTAIPSGGTQDIQYGGRTHGQAHTDEGDEIEALAAKLGITDSPAHDAPLANTVLASLANGKSAWRQIVAADLTSGQVAMAKIAEVTVGVATATIDFTNIPQTYRHLQIVLSSKNDAGSAVINMRLSGDGATFDSGANYDYEEAIVSAATTSYLEGLGQTVMTIGTHGAAANAMQPARILLPDYANTSYHKSALSECGRKDGTTSGLIIRTMATGFWRNTAAIAGVRLSAGTNNFAVGSRATLYGLPS
jgi:hypothetical protein